MHQEEFVAPSSDGNGDSQAWQVDGERKVENATEFSDYAASVPSKAVYRPRRSRAEDAFEPVAAALLRAASCGTTEESARKH